MINGDPSPLMTQIVANRSAQNYGPNMPTNTKFTMEQQYAQMAHAMGQQSQIQPQSNPYDDYIQTLASCSDLVKQKILQDAEYKQAEMECELLIKQLQYAEIIPRVMQYGQGRIAFEQLLSITKQLKQNYSQEEVQITQNWQALMQDEVVIARLKELQNQKSSVTANPVVND